MDITRRSLFRKSFGVVTGVVVSSIVPLRAIAEPESVVLPYRGRATFDAGLFYCPYIPLQMTSAKAVPDVPPMVRFNTRYGIVAI
jgi:hypothetical protein